ncbi:phospholipase D family protein [Rhodoglobus aureus]|uniref:Phospholipase D family protein n=1 Tax=Rhodoglobus aureus TaxID=191497 RepID=A0ABP4G2B9_9MICO
MLEPDSRAALTEQLRPPSGYELVHAVGTTFTLDLTSALAVPLSFAGHQVRESDDPIAILDAVRRASDRIDIFAQAGHIVVPRQASDLVAFLEPMVHPVALRRPGALFHPKVWILEYARGQHRSYRMLCSSRNITSDRSWDLVVRLDGNEGDETREQNEPLSDLVRTLPSLAVTPLAPERRERIEGLAERISNVSWELPADIRELNFHALGIGRPLTIDFAGQRHLVISPFLSDDGLANITASRKEKVKVISRAESFDRLKPETLKFIEPHVLDDAVRDSDEIEEDPLIGLHAKAYFLDRFTGSRAIIGSANATQAAFGGNVEFLIEMVGPKPRVGVRAVFGEDSELRKLTIPYETSGGVQETETEKADRALDDAIRSLATIRLRNTVRLEETDKYSIDVEAVTTAKTIAEIETEVQLLTRPGNSHSLPLQGGPPVVFTGLDLTEITPFVIIHAVDARGERRSTVVNAELIGDVAHRRDAVLARQIDTPEKFLRFLQLMLSLGGSASAQFSLGNSGGFGSWSSDGAGVFETLVRSLAVNPEGLDDLARLVERMRGEASAGSLPTGFDEVWEPVWRARLAQKGEMA